MTRCGRPLADIVRRATRRPSAERKESSRYASLATWILLAIARGVHGQGSAIRLDSVWLRPNADPFADIEAATLRHGPDALDADDNGRIGLVDAVTVLGYLFRRGAPRPPPPTRSGVDETADELGCPVDLQLGCRL